MSSNRHTGTAIPLARQVAVVPIGGGEPGPASWEESPAGVLTHARTQRRVADAAGAELLVAACAWADLHPADPTQAVETYHVAGGDTGVALAGEGAPVVSEFSIAEFAAVLGMSPEAGKHLVGQALELRHRLPRLWARVQAGELPAWRARRVAAETIALTPQAAGFVDTHLDPVAHRAGTRQVDRLVEEAIARLMPDRAATRARTAADGRHLTIHDHQVSFTGTVYVEGELDLADGLDLDAALNRGAELLKTLGSTDSLQVRRSVAAGDLARHQLALDLPEDPPHQPDAGQNKVRTGPRDRRVVLHLHLSETALTSPDTGVGVGRVANNRSPATADQIREWCCTAGQIVVKPVLDLADHVHLDAWEVPDRLAQHVGLRDHCCVFPWCPTRASRCDIDHVIPHAQGGDTCACNLAALCRRHHRLKTHHGRWHYTVIEPGTYLWTSPTGHQFVRDHTGTHQTTPAIPRHRTPAAPPPEP